MIYQQPFNDSLKYYYYNKSFSSPEIDKILFDVQNIPSQQAQTITAEELTNPKTRSSVIKWIPKTEEWGWVYQRMMEIALEANKQLWHFDLLNCETMQYTEYYASNGGHYTWHQDLGSEFASHRKVSISVQLSNPSTYTGGDLQLWVGGDDVVSVQKSLGEATIFPSYMMHRVTEVTSGTRKSLVLWIGGSHFR